MAAVMISINEKGGVMTSDNRNLTVLSMKDGIVRLLPWWDSTIQSWSEFIEGCFDHNSNFNTKILEAFKCDEESTFEGIKFEFYGIPLTVTSDNANKYKIVERWNSKCKLERARAYIHHNCKSAKNNDSIDAILIDISTDIQFKDEEAERNWKEHVEFSVNSRTVKYASRLAKYMQYIEEMKGKSIFSIADQASQVCAIEGITGFEQKKATELLIQYWKYGKELQEWNNLISK